MLTIEVVRINPVSIGNLKAFADVKIGDILIKDWRVIQKDGAAPWISGPQKMYEKDGQKKYTNLIEVSKELKQEIEKAILAKL